MSMTLHLLFLAVAGSGSAAARPRRLQLGVATDSATGSVSVMLGGEVWLTSLAKQLGVFNNGAWQRGHTELQLGSCRTSPGADAFGRFNATRCTWTGSPSGGGAGLRLVTGARDYGTAAGRVVLELALPDGLPHTGAANTVARATADQVTSWPALAPPNSTTPRLGWFTWHGSKINSCDGGGNTPGDTGDNSEWRCNALGPWTDAGIRGRGGAQGRRHSKFTGGAAGAEGGGDPFVVFDDGAAGEQRAVVVGSASHFMATSHVLPATGSARVSAGLLGSVQTIPAGFVQETLICAGFGVNAATRAYGSALLHRYNKTKAAPPDDTNDKIGYYTDNGAYLYYHAGKGPDATYSASLLEVLTAAKRQNIPFGHLQLDSWWYLKAANDGTTSWSPNGSPELGSIGTSAFYEQTGRMPVVSHNRFWNDAAATTYSGYRWAVNTNRSESELDPESESESEFNDTDADTACGVPLSTAFWADLFANASATWGMRTYEQDYIDVNWLCDAEVRGSVDGAGTWLRQMGEGAAKAGVAVQYCGAFLQHLLASVEISAVRQVRVSQDYTPDTWKQVAMHNTSNQWSIGTSSIIADALGVAAHKDVFRTATELGPDETRYGRHGEIDPALQAMVATLSGGPVVVGDPPHLLNRTLIMRTCRDDGVVLRASAAATTVDATFGRGVFGPAAVDGPDGELWTTHSDIPGLLSTARFGVVLAPVLNSTYRLTPRDFSPPLAVPAAAGRTVAFVAYTYRGAPTPFSDANPMVLAQHAHSTLAFVAPVLRSGVALLGERAQRKIVPVSPQRFARIDEDEEGGAVALLMGAAAEVIEVDTWVAQTGKVVRWSCTLDADGSPVQLDLLTGKCS